MRTAACSLPAGRFPRDHARNLPDLRRKLRPLCVLLLLPAALPGQNLLPPWCTDNMVLQQTTPGTKRGDVLLSGWAERSDVVTVEFVGKGRPIKPDLVKVPEQADLRKWVVTYDDLRPALAPSEPFRIVVTTKNKKQLNRLELTNVVAGDVWVIGQRPGLGVPVPPDRLKAMSAKAKGRVRYLPANSINWSNATQAVTASWREWGDPAQAPESLANVTYYFAQRLAEQHPNAFFGIIVVDYERDWAQFLKAEVHFAQLSPAGPTGNLSRFPPFLDAWQAAADAAREAVNDCQPVFDRFDREILRLKWEGKVFSDPLPGRIEPPTRLHTNNFPSLLYPVRGGLW
jgi:hypothetical protein